MSGGKAWERDSEILCFMNLKLCSNCLPQFQWTQLLSIWLRAGKFMYTLLYHAVWNCDLIHQWIFPKHLNILTRSYPGWYYYFRATALSKLFADYFSLVTYLLYSILTQNIVSICVSVYNLYKLQNWFNLWFALLTRRLSKIPCKTMFECLWSEILLGLYNQLYILYFSCLLLLFVFLVYSC